MGTMLQCHGLKLGEIPELLAITNPDLLTNIHRQYIEAGTEIVYANTFGANRRKMAKTPYTVADVVSAAIAAAKKACIGTSARVALDIGPLGELLEPMGTLPFETAVDMFAEIVDAGVNAGADLICIETMTDLYEAKAALLAAKEHSTLPVWVTMSFDATGRTFTGCTIPSMARTLEGLGADAIGLNCSQGPKQLLPLFQELCCVTTLPVIAKPNAGLPDPVDGHYDLPPEDFARTMVDVVGAGVSIVGGCCGTNPDYIRALHGAVHTMTPGARDIHHGSFLCTPTMSLEISGVRVIGERINPTGRKKLAAEIREGSLLSVKKEAVNQVKAGAELLDVNMGVAGIDAVKAMSQAVTEIAQLTDAPLAIDTSDPAALEAGLRAYPGRALINSVSAENDRIRDFLPLAKKYGAAILCLPITEDGVPKTAAERLKAITYIIDNAKKAGLDDGDFLLDALVMTVSADKNACREVLNTLQLYRQHLGYPSTMGLSNISFGLPNRPLINSTFFTMCLAAGLDAPIMNPYDESMQKALKASAALLGDDPCGLAFSQDESNLAVPKKAAVMKTTDLPILDAIKQAVIEGEKDIIVGLVVQALQEGKTGNEITEKGLTAAMTEIGEDFGSGRMFLPQVLLSAETMRAAFDKLKELIPASAEADKGTFVIATVKGDVHDLGKNITGALLANSGFKVIDLGKDVEADTIVETAIQQDADVVGLAALMTTTMPQIDKVIDKLQAAGARAKVMIGGAAVTQDYADSCGADAYAADGVKAVKLAKQIVGVE